MVSNGASGQDFPLGERFRVRPINAASGDGWIERAFARQEPANITLVLKQKITGRVLRMPLHENEGDIVPGEQVHAAILETRYDHVPGSPQIGFRQIIET